MPHPQKLNDRHGVLVNINGDGILIIGEPGIGKSSFALELLHLGHQLIADDVVELSQNKNIIMGSCPQMSSGLLHSRELGLITVTDLFGPQAYLPQHTLNYVLELKNELNFESTLMPSQIYNIGDLSFPLLHLSIATPASLYHRLLSWINMQKNKGDAEQTLKQRQQRQMDEANDS